jgi:hypothetical protein
MSDERKCEPAIDFQAAVLYLIGLDCFPDSEPQRTQAMCVLKALRDDVNAGLLQMHSSSPRRDAWVMPSSYARFTRPELDRWATERGDIQRLGGSSSDDTVESANRKKGMTEVTRPAPVPSRAIKDRFKVISHDDRQNDEWWTRKMGDAKDYGLLPCRAVKGTNGRSPPLWCAACVATWLSEKYKKEGWTAQRAADVLRRHFPDYSDLADLLSPPDA